MKPGEMHAINAGAAAAAERPLRPTSREASTANEWHLGHELAMSIDGYDARIAAIDGLSGRRLNGFLVGSIDKAHAELLERVRQTVPPAEIARIFDEHKRSIPVHDLTWRQPRANAS